MNHMDRNEKPQYRSGISTASLLGVAFVVLKLCHVIEWPWVWVLCPFWAGFLIAVILAIVAVIASSTDDY